MNGSSKVLRWRTWVSWRTSSQMLGSWNLPIFLLRDGSLTLMYMATLMVLVILCISIPTMEKFFTVMQRLKALTWSYMGAGAHRCSLNLSLKDLCQLTYIKVKVVHLYSTAGSTGSFLQNALTITSPAGATPPTLV